MPLQNCCLLTLDSTVRPDEPTAADSLDIMTSLTLMMMMMMMMSDDDDDGDGDDDDGGDDDDDDHSSMLMLESDKNPTSFLKRL